MQQIPQQYGGYEQYPQNQEYPQGQQFPQSPQGQQYTGYGQYPQQPQQYPQQAPGPVKMNTVLIWAGIAGAVSGLVQAALGAISSFDMVGSLISAAISAGVGIFSAILIGQFGAKIPVNASLFVKASAAMFVLNLAVQFMFGLGTGLGFVLAIAGIGTGALAYGFIVSRTMPNLV